MHVAIHKTKGFIAASAPNWERLRQLMKEANHTPSEFHLVMLDEVEFQRWSRGRDGERMPVMDGPSVDMALLLPYNGQARSNHGQSLRELARRGGVTPQELYCIVNGKKLSDEVTAEAATAWLNEWLEGELRGQVRASLELLREYEKRLTEYALATGTLE